MVLCQPVITTKEIFIKLLDSAVEQKGSHQKALIIMKNIFGEVHGDVAGGYNNLRIVDQALGQYNKAEEYLEKALISKKKIFGV